MMPQTNKLSIQMHPTLFVGLGQAGMHWIELIKRQGAFDAHSPVELLSLRMVGSQMAANHTAGAALPSGKILEFRWDPEKGLRQAASTPIYRWWQRVINEASQVGSIETGQTDRLDARMAFHQMIYFEHDDRLSAALKQFRAKVNVDNTNKLHLYLLVSAAEPDSAYLGDLIQEIYSIIERDNIAVCIPCILVPEKEGNQSELVAFLRELERFTCKGQVFEAGAETRWVESELFHHALFIDNEEYLVPLADQMAALTNVHTAKAFSANYANVKKPLQFSMMVSRSFSFNIPVFEIRKVCALRLVKEELLREHYFQITGQDIKDFLQILAEDMQDDWRFFQLAGRKAQGLGLKDTDLNYILQWNIKPEILNQKILEKFNHFGGSLADMVVFLNLLETDLLKGIEALYRVNPKLRETLPRFREIIHNYQKILKIWILKIEELNQLTADQYKLVSEQLKIQVGNSEFQQVFMEVSSSVTPQTRVEDFYYSELQGDSGWKDLVPGIRHCLVWQWELDGRQVPYLRCISKDWAFTDARELLSQLSSSTFLLIEQVAQPESIFAFLGKLSSAEIITRFHEAKALLNFTALPADTWEIHKFITGPRNDRITQEWRLGESTIQFCESPNDKRLVYTAFDYNYPISGSNFVQKITTKDGAKISSDLCFLPDLLESSKSLYAFQQEQIAYSWEKALKFKSVFSAAFVRVMADPKFFENIMWCLFFDWIFQSKMESPEIRWYLKHYQSEKPVALSLDGQSVQTLENIITDILLKTPLTNHSGIHPFSYQNNSATHAHLAKLIAVERKKSLTEKSDGFENIQKCIKIWQASNSSFERGLAVFQSHLLSLENRKMKTSK